MSNASQVSVTEPTSEHDQYSVSIPPLAVTTTSPLNYGLPIDKPVNHSSHSYETPLGLDSHNIRCIPPITSCSPPPVFMICNDPKLSPIHISILMSPFDNDSDNTTILGAQSRPTRGCHARKDLPEGRMPIWLSKFFCWFFQVSQWSTPLTTLHLSELRRTTLIDHFNI